MGFNTTVVILNDALSYIEKDPEFGAKLMEAILEQGVRRKPTFVSAGNHCNAALVVEQHHADGTKIIAVGQNCARIVDSSDYGGSATRYMEGDLVVLKNVLARMGYVVSKKRTKKSKVAP